MKNNFLKKWLVTVDWMRILRTVLLLIFVFYLNSYLVNTAVLKDSSQALAEGDTGLKIGVIAYVLSLAGISFYLVKDFSKSFFIKLACGYMGYLIVSYFLLVTRNLNDEKFDVWEFEKNHFFQTNFLPTLVIILALTTILTVVIGKIKRIRLIDDVVGDYKSNDLILVGLLSSFAINDERSLAILKSLVSEYLTNNDFHGYLLTMSANLMLSLLVVGGISYVALNSYKAFRDNKPTPELMVTTSLLLATIFNYTLQLGVKTDEPLLNKYIFPGASAYQILVLSVLFVLIYLLINRYLASTLLIVTLGTIISIVNSIKEGLRSEPLLITDFVWLKEISLLTSFVDKSVIQNAVFGILAVLVIYLILRKRLLWGPIVSLKRVRWTAFALLMGLVIGNFLVYRNEEEAKIVDGIPVVSKINNWVDINWMGFSRNASYKSLMYVWTKQLTKSVMETPKDYSEEKIKEIAKRYKAEAEAINATRSGYIEDQTVIFILSESFSDPTRLEGISLSKNVIPAISQVEADYTSGLMISDFYGGGTANMETQSLTGLPYSNLSSSVSVMNTEVLPKMTYIPSISSSYKDADKVAVHLHNAANYSRNIVYKDLGFDTFVALDGTDDKPTQLEFLSAGARDKSTYYAITSNLTKDTNQFFSVMTMQNHIPWDADEPADITATGQELSESETASLTSYARLLNITDTETENFLNELAQFDKKITVVFYGDHLPGLYPMSTFASRPESQFETDYFVWSNYDTEKLNYPSVKSSDFPALVLKQTNSKVSPYYALLTEILEANKQTREDDNSELSEDLKLIQYDLILGKGYILNDKNFFEVPK